MQRASGVEWTVIHVHGLAGWGVARAAARLNPRVPLVVTNQGRGDDRVQRVRSAFGLAAAPPHFLDRELVGIEAQQERAVIEARDVNQIAVLGVTVQYRRRDAERHVA